MHYLKRYIAFGFAHGSLLVASVAVYEYIYYEAYDDISAEYGTALSALIFAGSLFKLEMIALEWLLRNFGKLGRILNYANYYPLKYARYLQIGAAILLADYAYDAYYWGEEA